MKKGLLIMMVISIICAFHAFAADEIEKQATLFNNKRTFVPGEMIVKYKNASSVSLPSAGASLSSSLNPNTPKIKKLFKKKNSKMALASNNASGDKVDEAGVYKLTFEGRDDVSSLLDEIKNDPDVEYAEPNYLYQVSTIPNDPSYSLQWGYSQIGAPAAWDVTKGSSNVVIAVIDTGVDWRHQDLAANIWVNTKEVDGNGIDDDGNGYVDDVRGWDFVSIPSDWVMPGEDAAPSDNDPMDFHGHGTHVSGIAAGRPNNNIGIAGTAWNCKVMPLRAGYTYIDGGGYLEISDIAEAIYYAADNGASVINMSFGSLYSSKYLSDAINYAHNKGLILVASSGNVDSYDAGKLFYPAGYEPVIAVSAVDSEDNIAVWNLFAFSNFGTFVDICAPGSAILSTLPNNAYGYASGTSMAAPFVSGVAALIKSKHMDWTEAQVEERIKATSVDIYQTNPQAFLAGKLGAGRVNAKKALGNLSMAITYPKPSNKISGSVMVIGAADIEYFSSYKLECSNSSSPDAWRPIVEGSHVPVESGILALWNVSDPNGQYNLKLTINNSSGETYSCISGVNFGVNGEVNLAAKPRSGPSPYDPDAGDFLFYYELKNASDVNIYVYDISGTLVWQRQLAYDAGSLGGGGSAGENRVWWDGQNSFGESLSNGAYVYMVVAKDSGDKKIIGRGKFAVLRS